MTGCSELLGVTPKSDLSNTSMASFDVVVKGNRICHSHIVSEGRLIG